MANDQTIPPRPPVVQTLFGNRCDAQDATVGAEVFFNARRPEPPALGSGPTSHTSPPTCYYDVAGSARRFCGSCLCDVSSLARKSNEEGWSVSWRGLDRKSPPGLGLRLRGWSPKKVLRKTTTFTTRISARTPSLGYARLPRNAGANQNRHLKPDALLPKMPRPSISPLAGAERGAPALRYPPYPTNIPSRCVSD